MNPSKTDGSDGVPTAAAAFSDEQADALFAAGCDDGTPVSCDGLAWVHFDREASSLEEAVRSAVAQVRTAGLAVSKVELTADSMVSSEA